ncbi:antitoxin YezG family protein [Bhargavaea ginsengi]|uniref:immunity protein YezG family protein n=1 Tax=Bhargavaea ginsengi TaxID=426757 RepID=UPI00203BB5A8|nr:immunity protein YezG family protein [Bhargavaea ginsengi]MCM3087668.1 antitoxin YezG family protein [Bhargavaea ginsengi]
MKEIYQEIVEGYSTAYFYYYPESSAPSHGGEPVYSLDIPDRFEVDYEHFNQLKESLYNHQKSLWMQFAGQEPWTNLTLTLTIGGNMKMEYGYEDLSDLDPIEKQDRWEAKHIFGE